MGKYFLSFFMGFICLFLVFASGENVRDFKEVKPQNIRIQSKAAVKPDLNFGKFPLYFITNKGQVNQKARFYAKTSRYTLWLTKEGLVFDSVMRGRGDTTRDVSRLMFIGPNKNPAIIPFETAKLKVNYFKGNNKSKWFCDIPTSQAVLYKRLYKNIDLKVYGIEKQVEYDWIVKPGGNPGDIRFEYKNVKGTRLDAEGNLLIETDFGELMHKKPVAYQDGQRAVEATFKKIAENTYGFAVGTYDKSRELIIDPVVLAYSTYLGGGDVDYGQAIAVDGGGCVYVAGETVSTDFPTLNQYMKRGDNFSDIFVTKIDTTKSGAESLVYSTYLGGTSYDGAYGIAVDGNGNAYVAGYTGSSDFPTLNQYQGGNGMWDAFVTRLDTNQGGVSSLIYSTCLGGGDAQECYAIAVDAYGNAYVTGTTGSVDFSVLNQYQGFKGGPTDAFVTRLDTNQSGESSLIYSTYLGGTSSDGGRGIAVDNSGCVYVTGMTYSSDFPILNQYQDFLDGSYEAFVTRLDTNQSGESSLIYSTFLGGEAGDYGSGIAVDNSGCVYVTGYTLSTDFPTLNGYQGGFQGGTLDAFVTRLDTNQSGVSGLIYSTYLGGQGSEKGHGIALDVNISSNVYVTGETASIDFPTRNQYQVHPGGLNHENNAFVTRLDTGLSGESSLIYSTYLGGATSGDRAYSVAVDDAGNVYVTGSTGSSDFPILDQFQSYNSNWDAFVTKFIYAVLPTVTTAAVSTITPTSASGGGEVTSDGGAAVTARGVCWSTSENPTTDENYTVDGTGTGVFSNSMTGLTPKTVYYVRAYAVNPVGTAYGNQENFETDATPAIMVTYPNGGENLSAGSGLNITWTSEGDVGNVEIAYSINNGSTWKIIVQSTGNDGSYTWTVPSVSSDNCRVRVMEKDNDGGPSDVSDQVFSIVSTNPGTITLRTPNGGESFDAGSTQPIKWNSTGDINYVSIHFSTNNGTTWKLINQKTTNDGIYNWTVSQRISDNCLVKVTANDSNVDPNPSDVSDHVFSIVPPAAPVLEVTAPNGGEQLLVGSRFNIKWYASNSRTEAIIEYSVNGGQNWQEITGAAKNDGEYDWIIPDEPSDDCLVRVSEAGSRLSDVSDNVFSIVTPLSDDVIVTSPNGGENWEAGSEQEITWTTTGIDNSVAIGYSTDNGVTWKVITQVTGNDGSFAWTVPDTVSDECRIRVIANNSGDPKPSDVSDGVFSITFPSDDVVRIIAPNGGEQLVVGARFDITWYGCNSRAEVLIEYSVNDGQTWTDIAGAAPNDGNYNWVVPDTPSETCWVRITEVGSQAMDISNAVFSIVSPLSEDIIVTSPNGGETLPADSMHEITWTENGEFTNVTIALSTDNGITWQQIVQTTPNDGSFDWTVPDTPSDECLVRVEAVDSDVDPKPSDVSDQIFSIVQSAEGTLKVTAPNGGETWEVDSMQTITWTGNGSINTVMIQYSVDNGGTWATVVSSIGNDGSYNWQVPNTVSDHCLVRVSANDGDGDPLPSDDSDSEFSIVLPSSPTMRVITPNGGEQAIIGTTYKISWFGTDSRALIRIEYSVNGGETWKEITGDTENDGEYDWLVPDEPSNICLVRVSDATGQPLDISDAVFSIVPQQTGGLTVLEPNGGETLEAGSEYVITWSADGINSVNIERSVNNGETWAFIAVVPGDNGSYPWTVPDTASDNCLIRISGSESDENPVDVSDGVFSIISPSAPAITVTSPNGGETLTAGTEFQITWTSTGINNVLLEYSTDNRSSWHVIETVSADNNGYNWVVPNEPSDTCLIRISGNDPNIKNPLDTSDAVFSIIPN